MIAQKRVSFSNHREEVLESHEVELLLLASIPGNNLGMTEQVLERNLPCLLHPPLSAFFVVSALHASSPCLSVQSLKKWLVRGLAKFIPAVTGLVCPNLLGSFLTLFCKPFFRAL